MQDKLAASMSQLFEQKWKKREFLQNESLTTKCQPSQAIENKDISLRRISLRRNSTNNVNLGNRKAVEKNHVCAALVCAAAVSMVHRRSTIHRFVRNFNIRNINLEICHEKTHSRHAEYRGTSQADHVSVRMPIRWTNKNRFAHRYCVFSATNRCWWIQSFPTVQKFTHIPSMLVDNSESSYI